MALHERERAESTLLALPCPDGAFPSVGAAHPPAIGWSARSPISSVTARPARPTSGRGSTMVAGLINGDGGR